MLIDSHCHLDDHQFDPDRAQVLERARHAGVTLALAIGSGDGPPDLEAAIRLADAVPWIYATVGIHPHDASRADPAALENLQQLCSHPRVLAVGEIGLDYHYDQSPRDAQREVFLAQLEIAHRAGKPVVIHTRDAWRDTIDLLASHWNGSGIMHCFGGDYSQAVEALDLGLHISFAGILTFPKATGLREVAAKLPLARILVETDSPYLAPVPHRGKRNEPAFVVETVRALAQARGIPEQEAAAATTANFRSLFQLRSLPPAGKLEN
ncbi:MAG: TatD family hydrolase [Acidobacteria bacterium]|nr:TatD family hydrolase [Acidobacteriota bacterium]